MISLDNYAEHNLDFNPEKFEEYRGQDELKKKLALYTHAAQLRNEPLDHLLFFGPPGLGKTTLCTLMARVMNVDIKICSGPMLERTGDLVALLSSLKKKDIIFIDEIHRIPTAVEEVLYTAMENFRIDIIIGQGAGAQSVNLPLQPFTLIGATTKTGLISAPLRSRFGILERLDYYSHQELQMIIEDNAHYLATPISSQSALLIAQAARGTPRIAKKLLRRVRDFAQVENNNIIDETITVRALQFLGIDQTGLSQLDNALLKIMIEKFDGGPVGLETLASLLSEDSTTLEEVHEPYLIRMGYLEKSSRGRIIPYKILPRLKKKFFGQETLF
jgi:Holliday junction DNA helicase RuvB